MRTLESHLASVIDRTAASLVLILYIYILERRLQASSTPNILPIGQRLLQEGNRNEDENGGGSVDTLEFHKS